MKYVRNFFFSDIVSDKLLSETKVYEICPTPVSDKKFKFSKFVRQKNVCPKFVQNSLSDFFSDMAINSDCPKKISDNRFGHRFGQKIMSENVFGHISYTLILGFIFLGPPGAPNGVLGIYCSCCCSIPGIPGIWYSTTCSYR